MNTQKIQKHTWNRIQIQMQINESTDNVSLNILILINNSSGENVTSTRIIDYDVGVENTIEKEIVNIK